ncbi:polynucleotide kinase [Candidatus Rubidus massiliensis]|nr:polynucleotide kinase [Candidatus Rubidus massiliensis]
MNDLIKELAQGCYLPFDRFIAVFGHHLDLLYKLEKTDQDPLWHAEGHVAKHTDLVLTQIYKILDQEAKHLPFEQRLSLILAAAFHDIGKALVTKLKVIDGIPRLTATKHEKKGCSYLAYKLLETDLPYPIIQHVLRLVAYHDKPRRLVLQNAPKQAYSHLARLINVELLYYLAKADTLGRICKDLQNQCDYIELFRLYCEEYGVWRKDYPYEKWQQFFKEELAHLPSQSLDAILGYAIQDFEKGLIFTPEEAIARRYSYLQSFPQLIILCGPSGSGKSTWIENHLKDWHVISLDQLRQEYAKKRESQEQNSLILVKAKELLKKYLRSHQKVVWDATNLKKDFRSMIAQLGLDYHALVTIVVLHVPESIIYKGNNNREFCINKKVLQSQLESLGWIEDDEAHRVVFVNQTSSPLEFRGACHLKEL